MYEKISCKDAGSSASCVLDFIKDTKDVCMHSFLMLRNGKIFAEKGYHNIEPSQPQRLYSVTKSFAGAAIGMLIYDGYMSLDDKVVDILYLKSKYEWVNNMTLRDCLMMATCHNGTTYKLNDENWFNTFFETEPTHPSGTIFHYDTSAAHILGAIVENTADMQLMQYLRMKMDLSDGVDCIKSPEGFSWAGSGGIANLYDMAKLGELYMNGGVLNGRRLMTEEYARQAVSIQINNDSGFNHRWTDGYGYQIWITKYGYVFYGMGSQDVVCIPDKDFIFVCTADTMGENLHGKIIEDALLNDIVNKLDTGIEDTEKDNEILSNLKLEFPVPCETQKHINGSGVYKLYKNPMEIEEIELDYENGQLNYINTRGRKTINFGKGEYTDGVFPETHYFGKQIGKPAGRGYKYSAVGVWIEENKFQIKLWVLDDHTGGINITLSYKGDEIAVCMRKHGEWYLDEYSGFAGGKRT